MKKYNHEFVTLLLGLLGIGALGLRAWGKVSILALFLSYRLLSIILIVNCSVWLTRLYYEKKVLSRPIKINGISIGFVLLNGFLFVGFYGMMDFIVIAFG